MSSGIFMRKLGRGLFPDGDEAHDAFDAIGQGKGVLVLIKQPRNIDLLKRYWSILHVAVDTCDAFDDPEDADHWCRVNVPWMRHEYVVGERVYIRVKSIAVEEMPEDEFRKFYGRSMELLSEKIGEDIEVLAEHCWRMRRERR